MVLWYNGILYRTVSPKIGVQLPVTPPVAYYCPVIIGSTIKDVLEVALLKLIFERRLRGAHGSFQSPNP